MKVKFYGTRGSIAVSNQATHYFGGNTTCICVQSSCGRRTIVDAGTGIRELGSQLLSALPLELDLLFTHYHWDHIIGWPFFVPAFIPGNKIHLHGQKKGDLTIHDILKNLMSDPNFPVPLEIMGAELSFHDLEQDGELQLGENYSVRYASIFHPNGCLGFRFEDNGKAFAFLTDIEHEQGDKPSEVALSLCQGVESIAYDCQYTPEQYPTKVGWGHSTWEAGLILAKEVGAKQLIMIHHDPYHDDESIRKIVESASSAAEKEGVEIVAAFEGMEIDLS
jgi:phosphoribosyl 1,2-cyclic phosphodiesterase